MNTKETIIDYAQQLRRSEAGEIALAAVHQLLQGPNLDSENQKAVLYLLVGAWAQGLYGTVLELTRPKRACLLRAMSDAIITKSDADLLRNILRCWVEVSNDSSAYYAMTDHCHATLDAGENLADKLESIAKSHDTP